MAVAKSETLEERIANLEQALRKAQFANKYYLLENIDLKKKLAQPAPKPDFSRSSVDVLPVTERLARWAILTLLASATRLRDWLDKVAIVRLHRLRMKKLWGFDPHERIRESWRMDGFIP